MRKLLKTLIIMFVLLAFPLTLNAYAEDVTVINDLIENAKKLNGQEVTVQGEAIGEVMNRGDYSWVNINDGTNAIGIWLSKSDAEKIKYYGNYKNKGDTVNITGIFNRACKEHGGEADVHSNSIEIVENGHNVKEQLSSQKIITAIVLTLITLLSLLFLLKVIKSKETTNY